MYADEGMLGREALRLVCVRRTRRDLAVTVHAAQPVEERPQRGRKRVVGGREVRELRVTAVRRHRHAAQNRRGGRIQHGGEIGVPARPGADGVGLEVRMPLAPLRYRIDFGESVLVAIEHMPDRRLPERAREGHVLRVIEVLIAEEHDLPFIQCGTDLDRGFR